MGNQGASCDAKSLAHLQGGCTAHGSIARREAKLASPSNAASQDALRTDSATPPCSKRLCTCKGFATISFTFK
eukprot:48337-Amphidinium_carterae.3